MDSYRTCKDQQKEWAASRGFKLLGSKGTRGEPAYTSTLDENLFQPLSPETQREFERGDGDELKYIGFPVKMQAVHSSAALTVNVFDYWRYQSDYQPLTSALDLPPHDISSLEFEAKRAIMDEPKLHCFRKNPNLDVVLTFSNEDPPLEIALECKFTELYRYSDPEKKGLARAYLRHKQLWEGLPICRRLAEELSPRDDRFIYLHAAQLLRHVLGLRHCNKGSNSRFQLVYLWYDVGGSVSQEHRQEIDQFANIMESDRIVFRAMTFQDLIESLAGYRSKHEYYVDYLVGRYLEFRKQ